MTDPILLILDLDETLIHASEIELDRPADFRVFTYHVYKRPFLDEFLLACASHFTLAIWSSASDDYVEAVVKEIIPPHIPLAFVWGRSRCTWCYDSVAFETAAYPDYFNHYNYVKVLQKIKKKGFRLERTLIVDDTPSKSRRNYGNVIYPSIYQGEADDAELPLLQHYLLQLKDVPNVRTIEKRGWKDLILSQLSRDEAHTLDN